MIFNGKDSILGRLSTEAAKAALEGDEVVIVNANDIVIIGGKNSIVYKYKERRRIVTMAKGPFFPRTTIGIVKRSIRGMVKRKRSKGMDAFRRIKVYEGVPEEYKNKEMIDTAKVKMDRPVHKIKVSELANILKQNI